MATGVLLTLWFAYWSAESGASLPWSRKWQGFASWGSQLPEWIIAISVASLAAWGWGEIFSLHILTYVLILALSFVVSLAGKESGTWAYLKWTKDPSPNTERDGTLKGFNDAVGDLFGYSLGDEGYSWIWAATKGLIMTLPIGGFGVITHPLGHEIGSHAKGRLPGDPNMWKELAGGGLAYGPTAALFIYLVNGVTNGI